jgi:alpha-glucosidase
MNILSNIPADWWKSAVFYQIYPRSFYDADNNGIGDLKGITQKLDYLNDGQGSGLGIDAIWISPFFKSPMKDFGYDVSDFCDIDPIFGTMADFDEMISAAHQRGIKVLVDLVLNHCSDLHPWFQESKKNRTNPKSDWFVWEDKAADGGPPNNWLGVFGGSAWEYEPVRDQYYLHNFLKEQPDLNWYHPEVQEAICNIIRFWLDKGVDGFRLDTANFYAYDRKLRDNPRLPEDHQALENRDGIEYDMFDACFSKDRPENLNFLNIIRLTINEQNSHATTIGEIGGIQDLDRLIKLASSYVKGENHLHMAYTFSLLGSKIEASKLFNIIGLTEKNISDGWPCWSFGNHDCSRVQTRCETQKGNDFFHENLMLLLLCMRGTPIIYYGDELGMPEYAIKKEELQDPFGVTYWPDFPGRDGCRIPFPWDNNKHAQGFNDSCKPWLPAVSPVSLDQQLIDPGSMFALTKEMIQIRKKQPALATGSLELMKQEGEVVAFQRINKDQSLLIACNFGNSSQQLQVDINRYNAVPIQAFQRTGKLTKDSLEIPPYGFSILIKK